MIRTEAGRVRIPEPPNKNGYLRELYNAVRELQSAIEFDLSSICADNLSEYGREQIKKLAEGGEE